MEEYCFGERWATAAPSVCRPIARSSLLPAFSHRPSSKPSRRNCRPMIAPFWGWDCLCLCWFASSLSLMDGFSRFIGPHWSSTLSWSSSWSCSCSIISPAPLTFPAGCEGGWSLTLPFPTTVPKEKASHCLRLALFYSCWVWLSRLAGRRSPSIIWILLWSTSDTCSACNHTACPHRSKSFHNPQTQISSYFSLLPLPLLRWYLWSLRLATLLLQWGRKAEKALWLSKPPPARFPSLTFLTLLFALRCCTWSWCSSSIADYKSQVLRVPWRSNIPVPLSMAATLNQFPRAGRETCDPCSQRSRNCC